MTTTTTASTSTGSLPPLLCSVGTKALLPSFFPPDRSCDIVIYEHVRVLNSTVIAAINDLSYEVFKNACRTYTDTTCGLSFDVHHLKADMFKTVQVLDELNALKRGNRVNHYGILNIYNTHKNVENISTGDAPNLLQNMRAILGDDRQRSMVFVGIGFYTYPNKSSWADLEYIAENIAVSGVDIVVILSTVLTIETRDQCVTMPVNAYRARNDDVPSLEGAKRMATSAFSRPTLTVAFALQMGVITYHMPSLPKTPQAGMYQNCTALILSDYSQACQVPQTDLYLEKTAIGLSTQEQFGILNRHFLLTFDTADSMIYKAMNVMERSDTRPNLTWLLVNADLTDFTGQCLTGGPFERITRFRDFYYQQAQMPKG